MRATLAILTTIFFSTSAAAQTCIEPEDLIDGTVSISRPSGEDALYTLRGSAWFIKQTEIVAIRHVVEAFALSHHEWREISITQQYPGSIWWNEVKVQVRVKRTVAEDEVSEGLHILELKEPLAWPIQLATLRTTPFVAGEPAIGIAYSKGTLTAARGQFVPFPQPVAQGHPMYFANFELVRRTERDVLFAGSSGGPIFDCEGRVMGVISRIYPESMFGVRVRSSQGQAELLGIPNVLAVPVYHIAKKLAE